MMDLWFLVCTGKALLVWRSERNPFVELAEEKNAIADEATKVIVVQQDEKLIHHSNALAFQMAISKNKQV